MDWKNFGDAGFGTYGGWLLAKDPEVHDAYYGLFLATSECFPTEGADDAFYVQDAWVNLDRWEEGRADPGRELADLAEQYDSPEMAEGIAHARSVLGDFEVAFLLLDSGLEDANRRWLVGGEMMVPVTRAEACRHMDEIGAGRFAPDEED